MECSSTGCSSPGGDCCAASTSSSGSGGSSRGRPWLKFPPPPPFPPSDGLADSFQDLCSIPGTSRDYYPPPTTSTRAQVHYSCENPGPSSPRSEYGFKEKAGPSKRSYAYHGPASRDYSYAYYESGPSTTRKSRSSSTLNGHHHHHKHAYTTRYGTQENLYEEIGPTDLAEEVRYVHSKHLQVLDELNLSVEAMLMPPSPSPPPQEPSGELGPLTTEELLASPATSSLDSATCSMDSGFSSSSTGTNSLGRGAGGSLAGSTPGSAKKKTPYSTSSFWRKLSGGFSGSVNSIKPADEPRCHSGSWEESSHDNSRRSSCSDVELSSGDESNRCGDGKSRQGSRRSMWRRSGSPETGLASTGSGRLSRWFMKKPPNTPDTPEPLRGKMPLLPEEEEFNLTHRRVMAPTLPPPPPHLSPQQLKMRHIVEAIVQSENSYLNTLHRLVYDYKKPLEEASPAILSSSKISTLFHRLPEILQCHTLFRIALAEAVANWDREHRIGDVFVASFSKAVVLDIYSDFINNFSVAMDLARSETKKKPALAEFFKSRQVNSPDRLSFFGLMVKPVQRFPQFILFLQDLLQNTGQGHPERMSLQLALTQLESLAELLNERKREAEQAQAFRQMMRVISTKIPPTNSHKYLIRHDDVTQLEVNQCGLISKYKSRRLLLLNDQLVCVALSTKEENINSQPRLTHKWNCPITDIQIIEPTGSPTMSRLLTPSGSLTSSSSGATDTLCMEMSQLMHDYQVISRIHSMTTSLKGSYQEINQDVTRGLLDSIQREIQRKDEQMAWLDSCCLQFSIRGKEEIYTFQMNSQEVRKEWITELRLAKLALDPNNSPAWEIPEQELRPSTKMPLFVAAHPVYTSQPMSDVVCGTYYTASDGRNSYLWVCTSDGVHSHVSIAQTNQTNLRPVTQLQLLNTRVTSIEYVKGSDTMWIGTGNQRLLIYTVTDIENPEDTNSVCVPGNVTCIKQHCDNVFVSLDSGRLLLYRKHTPLSEPEEIILGTEPVSCLLPINLSLYAASGKTVTVMSALTGELQKSFTIQHEHVGGSINLMAHSGVGLWLSLTNSSTICLYHTETFKHLQDINVASSVLRVTGCPGPVRVSCLLACRGLLWVGTDSGVALTVPLPRLEGVPIISGRVNISYHAHSGPLSLLLPLSDPPTILKRPPSKALASDVYGLYGQLMYVKDLEEEEKSTESLSRSEPRKEHTLVTVMGGRGYVNYQQCCYKNIASPAHIVLWEMKL